MSDEQQHDDPIKIFRLDSEFLEDSPFDHAQIPQEPEDDLERDDEDETPWTVYDLPEGDEQPDISLSAWGRSLNPLH